MPGSNSRPNVSEGYEVPTELPGSTGFIPQHNHSNTYQVVTSIVVLIMSIIVPSRHTTGIGGGGAWVNSNLYTSILYNFINFHARVLYNTEYTGSLG